MTKCIPMDTGAVFESNLSAPFYDRARRCPGATALVFEDREISYSGLAAAADALIDTLLARGIRKGDRVAYMGWNHPALLTTLLAVTRIGGVFVAINPRNAPPECAFILGDCGARAIVAGAEFIPLLEALRPQLGLEFYFAASGAAAGWTPMPGDAPSGAGIGSHGAVGEPEDTAVLIYTSGTTGRAKGVMLSHANVWAGSQNIALVLQPTAASVLLGMAPMFHVAALALAISSFAVGGSVVILKAFEPDKVYDAIKQRGANWSFGVPTMLQALQAHPAFRDTDFSGFLMLAAGAPVPPSLLRSWGDAGVRVLQGYGMTETTGTSSMLDSAMALEKLGSAGLPFPLTGLQLRDAVSGEEIREAGCAGEIHVRGRSVTRGYWGLPEESARRFDKQGWFATGDIGSFDADGYLYIVDRLKDMIITGGVNVYPAEVERELLQHPRVAAAAVIGLPDGKWGERVTAVLVSKDHQAIGLDELQEFCRERLGGYKIPRQVEMVEALPINASGKVLKRELRERFCGAGS